ncbi:UDP-glucose:glycoprotein glucosyltransferase 1-like isoform X2 [Dendronephthya gigantea]|uniref:UDP-glucose:glycoprotein glucosyltransferase 1-like isoform X2 n=1 Tax=Dendronephthya gigantea TaxID=151771 RepID=UPI00106BF175|nr:UDP-glucose:glycoprotein glucosyltransferase 1-like isoform X2 [Dendronephthya gigantea]
MAAVRINKVVKKKLLILLAVVAVLVKKSFCTSKPVIATLDAKWPSTPISLESSEFLAKEGNDKFWEFVELTKSYHNYETHLDQYNFIIESAGKLLSPTLLNLFKFSLSIRYFSPTIELFNQVSKQLSVPDCAAFIEVDSQVTCDLDEAVRLIDNSQQQSSDIYTFTFDHVYPSSGNNPVTAILYGELGTKIFGQFHEKLQELVQEGKIRYLLRHYVQNASKDKVRLSGYGVELAVKNTEYKAVDDSKIEGDKEDTMNKDKEEEKDIDGFLFGKLRKLHPDLNEQLEQLKSHLLENSKIMAPLKVWQLQDLSFQAAQRVMSTDGDDALNVLQDLSQNLPSKARSLVKTKVSEEMRKEILSNQQEFRKYDIHPGSTELFINGLQISVEDLNTFSLLDLLKEEGKVLDRLSSIGVKGKDLASMLTMSVEGEEESYAVDMRHHSVFFVNDLEHDAQYRDWPSSVTELLRPTFMGMLRYIAKNIFNLVLCIDPLASTTSELINLVDEMIQNQMPIRFGLVLVTEVDDNDVDGRSDAAVGIARSFYFIANDDGPDAAFIFLTKLYANSDGIPTADEVYSQFKKQYSQEEADEILGPNTDHDDLRKSAKLFFDRIGLRRLPQAVMNGVPLDIEDISMFEEMVGREIMIQTGPLQQAVYTNQLRDDMDVYKYIMEKPNVVKRLNTIIQDSTRPRIDLVGRPWTEDLPGTIEEMKALGNDHLVDIVRRNMNYFIGKNEMNLRPITYWIITDLKNTEGRKLFAAALDQMVKSENNRVGVIYNGVDPEYSLPVLMEAILNSDSYVTSGIVSLVKSILNDSHDYDELSSSIDAIIDLATSVKGFKIAKLKENLERNRDSYKRKAAIHQLFCDKVLNLKKGDIGIVVNGRVLAPLQKKDIFISDDFELLETLDMDTYARKIRNQVDGLEFEGLDANDDTSEYRSDVIMKLSSVLGLRSKKNRQDVSFKEEHSMLHFTNAETGINVVALMDPLSNGAQKLIPVLMVLRDVTRVNMKIYMNCREKLSEMPLKRFYRYVLAPNLQFNEDGSLSSGPHAMFRDIPETPLLTMNLDIPQAWMVEAVKSPYDLDNIYLKEVEQSVVGNFELEYILIEGHCSDMNTGQPPRGLQFTLGTKSNLEQFDTIVMANLGYFQLKASPGSWILQLREGRSKEIFDIESISGSSTAKHGSNEIVVVDNFLGEFLKAKVKRKSGKEEADLLADEVGQENGGLWDSISNIVGGGKPSASSNETINIFSVASGHLYERFLRIMMLTVMKNTKSPVKFWFLKNYLSPTFQSFVPYMANEYGFQYEFVQYKWPGWLHHQTEKQRIIWGYKILFLDVLFPLSLKKIIFVDADLIVRADLKELMDLDLERAAYAYTPFCNSRTEMDGFRFWKQGYWRNHLGHRPYHISALYVIDLKRFRKLAAGDRLRGQYQGLSQDPNSLSNLDQDLPNNMIHQVPMKSLPQEWLWCETWCDDASKPAAKTIDLCNNPLTKEPKLVSAVRIVKEWPDYDNEIKRLQERVATNRSQSPRDERNNAPEKDEL